VIDDKLTGSRKLAYLLNCSNGMIPPPNELKEPGTGNRVQVGINQSWAPIIQSIIPLIALVPWFSR